MEPVPACRVRWLKKKSSRLNKLSEAIMHPDVKSGDGCEDGTVSLVHRAEPILDLLNAANRNHDYDPVI